LTKEFIDKLEKWEGNYYNPETDEIHVLEGALLQYRALMHERAHAQRKNALTFKLSKLIVIPQVCFVLVGTLAMLAALTLTLNSALPLLTFGAVFLFLLSCVLWEEYKANEIMNYETNLLKNCKGDKKCNL
jgi:uncharacterized Tic20 family protein